MSVSTRVRLVGISFAVAGLVGCSSIPGLDGAGIPFVDNAAAEHAKANEQALKATGRLSARGVLAPMDTAPTELYTREEKRIAPQECMDDSMMCFVLWGPIDEDQVMVYGAYGPYGDVDATGGQFTTSVDTATGEATWSVNQTLPIEASQEACGQATPSALVCMVPGEDSYTLRTRSLKDGQQIAEATFGEGSVASLLGDWALANDMSRHGDSVYVMTVLGEHDDPSGAGTLHSAKIAADGSIEWLTAHPASLGSSLTLEERSAVNMHVLGDQVIVTGVTTPDGEPLALEGDTGESVPITSENADAWSKIADATQPIVDDGSAGDYEFRVDDETSIVDVVPAGSDQGAVSLWPEATDWRLTAVCDGTVVLMTDPLDEDRVPAISVRAVEDGAELWNTFMTADTAVSCDGTRVILADDISLSARDAQSGIPTWSMVAPWDSVTRILPLDPIGPSTRFAVLGAKEDPDKFADVDTFTVFETP